MITMLQLLKIFFESGIFGISGLISADLSSFALDFSHVIWKDSGITYYEHQEGIEAFPSCMDVDFGQDASWAFNIQGIPWGFGVSAAITPASNGVTDVTEPSTLAIFALGMIGLVSRRFNKQS
jgi:hypothetical protein